MVERRKYCTTGTHNIGDMIYRCVSYDMQTMGVTLIRIFNLLRINNDNDVEDVNIGVE